MYPKMFKFPDLHSLTLAQLWASYPPLAHITPFLVLEKLPVISKVHNCIYFSFNSNCPSTFCLEISHSSFKPQLTSSLHEGPFSTYCYSKDSDFRVVPDMYAPLLEKWSYRTVFYENVHLPECEVSSLRSKTMLFSSFLLSQTFNIVLQI